MKNQIFQFISKMDRRHVQLFLATLYVVLLVIGAGAPGASGDVGQ